MPQRRKKAPGTPPRQPAKSKGRSTPSGGAAGERAGPSDTLKERAHSRLRQEILNGKIPQGSDLREADLSRRLGISRTPLREAISRLAEEGLVEVLPYRGARVVCLDGDHLREIFEVREAVEGLAARLAAARMSEEHIAECRQRFTARLREVSRRPTAYHVPTRDFHHEILHASGNELLIAISYRLHARLTLARAVSGAFHQRWVEAAREHLAILAAVEERDACTAERLMRRHIRQSRDNLMEYFKGLSREQERAWTG